jgi:hypothetical protein
MEGKHGRGRRRAGALAALSLIAAVAVPSDSGVGANVTSAPTNLACRAVTAKVKARHWVWVRLTRKVHGRRVLVRRHGKPVYVHVRTRYLKSVHRRHCTTTSTLPFTASAAVIASAGPFGPPPAAASIRPPADMTPPGVFGTPQFGQTLVASSGSWSEAPTGYAYQWLRCDASGGSCSPIAGATAATYVLGPSDVGAALRVTVTASNASGPSAPVASAPTPPVTGAGPVHHLEYVFEDGRVSVYDADHGYSLVKTISLPQTIAGTRGVTVAPATHMLFISYGGDGLNFNGSVLAYDLLAERVVWTVHLKTGIDSGQVSPDGKWIYMPTGENSPSGIWNILDTSNGAVVGTIQGGAAAHNTVASHDGRYVYLGGRNYNYLGVYDTATRQVHTVGPLVSGVRPFTVNGSNTLAFTTATGFDGFQVSSITTGGVLFTVQFAAVPSGFRFTGPSHGISLSPDERQLFVIDSVDKAVQVYDVSRVTEGVAPTHIDTIPVTGLSGTESPCAYDCGRGGWLQRSVDGRFVYVGDSGEVIETATRRVIANLPALLNTKKSLEVDWSHGVPVTSSERTGVGEVG